jgi:hypothetical protein
MIEQGGEEAGARRRESRRERLRSEARRARYTRSGGRRTGYWELFEALVCLFGCRLRLVGPYEKGVLNALDVWLTRLEVAFKDLPMAFNSFRIV